ncbi:pho2 [Symbiodinium sp. CCMP2592]|nr:pho2 [Symbiodinium sp. CCMP2592]
MPVTNTGVCCHIHKFHAMPTGMILSSVLLLLPLLAAGATIGGEDREVSKHRNEQLEVEVSSHGDQRMKRAKLLRKEEHRLHASLLSEAAFSTARRTALSVRAKERFLPQFPTGPATCAGSQLSCPADASEDPCGQMENCSIGSYHNCEGNIFKMCIPKKEDPTECGSSEVCLLRCTGVFAEEKSDGSKGTPTCSDLAPDVCDGRYVADKDYLNNGLGYECQIRDDKTCGVGSTCGVQNPPESLGEKQCTEPEVFKGSQDGTCKTMRTRPGHECTTRCTTGYTPNIAKLLCLQTGEFNPKTFECEANPCTVKPVANALASGCKEGPNTGDAVITSGESCTVQCKENFYPSDELLRCHAEVLTPASFTCEAPCEVPKVANAAQSGLCREAADGEKILPFTSCTTQCAAGYTPSVESLSCRTGTFTPATETSNSGYADAMAVSPIREAKTMQYHEFVSFETYVFDCDGVLWGISDEDSKTSVSTVNHLLSLGKRVMFVTNNSNKTRSQFLQQLEGKGSAGEGPQC